ncbi:hypothetical protein ABZ387_34920 [Streptomyces flaveolus]|uniref:hypothetical protein n=1 Tax=Streptomyces flaveolus TaxID=67297 RepID=UPI003407DE79
MTRIAPGIGCMPAPMDALVELPRSGPLEKPRLFPDQGEAVERLVRHLHRPGTRGLFVSA